MRRAVAGESEMIISNKRTAKRAQDQPACSRTTGPVKKKKCVSASSLASHPDDVSQLADTPRQEGRA